MHKLFISSLALFVALQNSCAYAESGKVTAKSDDEFDCTELAKLWNMALKHQCKIQYLAEQRPEEFKSFNSKTFDWKTHLNSIPMEIERVAAAWQRLNSAPRMSVMAMTDPGLEPDYPNRSAPPFVVNPTNRYANHGATSGGAIPAYSEQGSASGARWDPFSQLISAYVYAYRNLRSNYYQLTQREEFLKSKTPTLQKLPREDSHMELRNFRRARERFEKFVGSDATKVLLKDMKLHSKEIAQVQ